MKKGRLWAAFLLWLQPELDNAGGLIRKIFPGPAAF
jgi:hypothetical protein